MAHSRPGPAARSRTRTPGDIVVITGSSGFIGSALVRRLAPRYRLVGLDRAKHHTPPPQAECVCIDLADEDDVASAFERLRYAYGDRIASVVHLAAYYDFSGEDSPLYDEVTVGGTRRLLRHLQDFDVEQFIFSSTMLVHAPSPRPGVAIAEDSPLDPTWPYPRSKVETERLIREERSAIPTVVLRIAGVYDDWCRSIPLAHQIQRIHEDRLISHVFPGDLSHGQSFVHLDDVVDAVARAVDGRDRLPEETVALVGEPETMGYGEIQDEVGRILHGKPWPTREIPKALAKAGAWLEDAVPGEEPFIKPWMIDVADDHYELDVSRAERLLGWRPRRSLRDALPVMIRHLREDPARWYALNGLGSPASWPREVPPPGVPSP